MVVSEEAKVEETEEAAMALLAWCGVCSWLRLGNAGRGRVLAGCAGMVTAFVPTKGARHVL